MTWQHSSSANKAFTVCHRGHTALPTLCPCQQPPWEHGAAMADPCQPKEGQGGARRADPVSQKRGRVVPQRRTLVNNKRDGKVGRGRLLLNTIRMLRVMSRRRALFKVPVGACCASLLFIHVKLWELLLIHVKLWEHLFDAPAARQNLKACLDVCVTQRANESQNCQWPC